MARLRSVVGGSANRGGRGYQRPDDAPRACVCNPIVRVRANDPSSNRNACLSITPPTILGSRHFHISSFHSSTSPPTRQYAAETVFSLLFSTRFIFIFHLFSFHDRVLVYAVVKTVAKAPVLPRSGSLSCLASVRIISLYNILKRNKHDIIIVKSHKYVLQSSIIRVFGIIESRKTIFGVLQYYRSIKY